MVRRPGDEEESPPGGGAGERLRQFIDEHFGEGDRPDSLPENVVEGDEADDTDRAAGTEESEESDGSDGSDGSDEAMSRDECADQSDEPD